MPSRDGLVLLVDAAHRGAGVGPAGRDVPCVAAVQVGQPAVDDARRRLGHAPAGEHRVRRQAEGGEQFHETPHHRGVHGLSAVHDAAQPAQVPVLAGQPVRLVVDEGQGEVGGPGGAGPVTVGEGEPAQRVGEDEFRAGVHLVRPEEHVAQMEQQQPAGVVQRHPVEGAGRGAEAAGAGRRGAAAEDVVVGEHHGLGRAGGARGEQQDGEVVRAAGVAAVLGVLGAQLVRVAQPGGGPAGVGAGARGEGLVRPGDGVRPAVAVPDRVQQAGGGGPGRGCGAGADGQGDEAAQHAGPEGGQQVRLVGDVHDDPVPGSHSRRPHPGRQPACLLQQTSVAPPCFAAVGADEAQAPGAGGGRGPQERRAERGALRAGGGSAVQQ